MSISQRVGLLSIPESGEEEHTEPRDVEVQTSIISYYSIIQGYPQRLVLVRHGQSELNASLDRLTSNNFTDVKEIRDANISLTPRGVFQAEYTGQFLADLEPFDVAYSSPYERAIATAREIIAELPNGADLPLRYSELIREKSFGRLCGLSAEDVKAQFPIEYEGREREGRIYYRGIGGENYMDVMFRVRMFLNELKERHPGQSVLIVTHQVTLKCFKAVLDNLTPTELGDLPYFANAGMAEFIYSGNGEYQCTVWGDVAYPEEIVHTPVGFTYTI